MPKVSIITPCFNSEQYIGQAVRSVQNQSFPNWEHIIVDDGSTDGSAAVLEAAIANETGLRLIRQDNCGVAAARNAGFRAASFKSQYLLFLDADDVLHPSMLDDLVQYLEANRQVGLVYCNHEDIDQEGAFLSIDRSASGWGPRYVPSRFGIRKLRPEESITPFASILGGASIAPSMSLIRRSVYEMTPQWDEAFGHVHEDADLFLHIALRSEIHYIPDALVAYRQHPAQATKNPQHVAQQAQKLHGKWRDIKGLTKEQRVMVQSAWQFFDGRIVPCLGVSSGNAYARKGHLSTAMRFYIGAIRRYAFSLETGNYQCACTA